MSRGLSFVVSGLVAVLSIACGDDGATGAPETILDISPAGLTRERNVEITFRADGAVNGFVCSLDSGAPQACESPFTAEVEDGDHTFEVSATFGARIDDTPAMAAWTVDATPPETMITIQPPVLDNSTMPTFEFNATDAMTVSYECSLDGGPFVPCTSPFPVTVGDGQHTFEVRGVDAAGNVDATPASFTWTVDTSTPDTTITSGPAAGATTGSAVEFGFESNEATATFQCSTDGAAFAACTTPAALTLGDGAHTFAVRAVDPGGQVDPSPALRAWTVDALGPTVTITDSPASPSNDSTPTYTFLSPDGGISFECAFDAGAYATCASPFTPATPLADGDRTFRVRATDATGNTGAPATATFTLVTAGFIVTITGGPATITNDATPTFTFTAPGAVVVECRFDAAAYAACTSPFTPANLGDGTYTFFVRGRDAAGNEGIDTLGFTVDTIAPDVMITSAPASPTNDRTADLTFMVTGTATSVVCAVDAAAPLPCTSPFTTASLADGSHTVTVTAADAGGNTDSDSRTFVVDGTPPTLTLTGPTGLINDATPTYTFTAPGATVIECRFDTAAFAPCASPFTPAANLAQGAHTFDVRARDAAGNEATAQRAFTVDTIAPTIAWNPTPAATIADATPTFNFTVGGAPDTTTCALDGGAAVACAAPSFTAGTLSQGSHSIVIRVADTAGNANQVSATFTVDTVAPVVTITSAPTSPTSDRTADFTFTVTGTATSVVCAVDAAAPLPCTSPFATASLADGSHTVTVTAADAVGNTDSDSRTFLVDGTPPTLTLTGPTGLINDATPTYTFTAPGATVIECRFDTAAFAPCASPFTPAANLAQGAHTFDVRARDAAGNEATAQRAFTVDTIAPTIAWNPTPATTFADTTPTFNFTVGGAPDTTTCAIDGAPAVACAAPSFTAGTLAQGSHSIVIRVADTAGNANQVSATFTVDTVAPVVTIGANPPANWPVNYYEYTFTAPGATVIECSINGAAFTACASPAAVNGTTATTTFAVRARDAAGNQGSDTASWTAVPGLVLHYAYEQGSTANTSLLQAVPDLSPNGSTATLARVGGWAGTALGRNITRHGYPRTGRPLSSSPSDGYTASFWIRPSPGATGTILDTRSSGGGFAISIGDGTQLRVEVVEPNGARVFRLAGVSLNRWTNVTVVTTGAARDLFLYINGSLSQQLDAVQAYGFGPSQSDTLLVGPVTNADLDDVRFYNVALSTSQICAIPNRGGFNGQGQCVPLTTFVEYDFETPITLNSGTYAATTSGFSVAPTTLTLGGAARIEGAFTITGAAQMMRAAPGHSFAFWFLADGIPGNLMDYSTSCQGFCGIVVSYSSSHRLDITARAGNGNGGTASFQAVAGRPNNIVIAERRAGSTTTAIVVVVNGVSSTIPIGGADLFSITANDLRFAPIGTVIDEWEFWPADLAATPEMLCENGIDGEWDPATGTCALVNN